VKNRMREICTSGSVRDGDGNAPIYSAFDPPQLGETAAEDTRVGQPGERPKERELAGIEVGLELLQEQPTEQAREHPHWQEEAGPTRDPARPV
jgi:hypothetical protein